MKARIAFDTLAYANRLKAAGLDPKIAEAQAEANADMVASLLDSTLATKQDIFDTKQGIADVRQEVADTRQDIANVRQEVADLASATKQDIAALTLKMAELEIRLMVRLGTITVASITVATGIISMLRFVH